MRHFFFRFYIQGANNSDSIIAHIKGLKIKFGNQSVRRPLVY